MGLYRGELCAMITSVADVGMYMSLRGDPRLSMARATSRCVGINTEPHDVLKMACARAHSSECTPRSHSG